MSYWTKRRRLHENIDLHMSTIELASQTTVDENSLQTLQDTQLLLPDLTETNFVNDLNAYCSDDTSSESMDSKNDIAELIANWAIQYNITHSALSALLKILVEKYPNIPTDAITLL
ncbi:hypothetical protein SNE40_017358 [Patella caerulea]|uniref:Uncharacterized protein n=1 Tax=Patella caerulea TaxID=87958 RepID=A0AAN8PPX1_PATCE